MLRVPCRFSPNQLNYFLTTRDSWLNIAEGGKRAGKNIVNTFAFCNALEISPTYVNLIGGVDQSIAQVNIMDCDGFGVSNYFYGRIREGKYKEKKAYFIRTKTGEKVVIVAGGSKQTDYKFIKGLTLGCVYLTEVNELHPSFVQECMDRTASHPFDRRIFFDLNPKAPNHWFYKWMGVHSEKQKKNSSYGFNYGHFTMADNMSMSDEEIRAVIQTYDVNSIYYKRDIKGISIAVEGVCFPLFANNPRRYLISKKDFNKNDLISVAVGVDFGGNGSQHTFVARGYTKEYRKVVFLKSKIVLAKNLSPQELEEEFCKFVKSVYEEYCIFSGEYKTRYILIQTYCDSAEQTLINGLRVANDDHKLYNEINNAKKININDRIRLINFLLKADRVVLIEEDTESLQEAWKNAVWSQKEADKGEDVRLDDGTSDIDTCDAAEYTIERDLHVLEITRKE